MAARGRGALGDKTVLDSLDAVATALGAADGTAMREQAVAAARQTVESFKTKPSRLGRARMFGDKSVGLPDPGQLALLRIAEAL
jgi:dihydroxyacetone kinase-like protein